MRYFNMEDIHFNGFKKGWIIYESSIMNHKLWFTEGTHILPLSSNLPSTPLKSINSSFEYLPAENGLWLLSRTELFVVLSIVIILIKYEYLES